MAEQIPESDWRQFKQVRQECLEQFCQQTLDVLGGMARSIDGTAHERYLRAYRLLDKRDEAIARAFNDFRRSTAIMQLVVMRHMGLVTDEQLSGFSEQTQHVVRQLDEPRGASSSPPGQGHSED